MTTSAPQWPGQEDIHERRTEARDAEARDAARDAEARPSERPDLRAVPDARVRRLPPVPGRSADPAVGPRRGPAAGPGVGSAVGSAVGPPRGPAAAPGVVPSVGPATGPAADPSRGPASGPAADPPRGPAAGPAVGSAAGPGVGPSISPSSGSSVALGRARRRVQGRLTGRGNRFAVVPDPTERDLRAARRRARPNLPSPVAVTRDIALALLEVEAGCRSAAQLERVVSPELWETLEHRICRRGGPLPSGRSVMAVRCQEDAPGLADTVAVVRKGDLVRPVALRLDASRGRWVVTELRWWRNETDTATTSSRDGGPS
jgi:Family of unknown function (DUF6459)